MISTQNGSSTVVRTGRGLSIAGTRITLYTILDYLHADWPPKLIQDWLNLTESQMSDVLQYIADHRDEVEAEYQQVVQQAEETRRYWEARNHGHVFPQTPTSLTPEQQVLWEKLQAWKARIEQA
jgi:uncharacterized protein (DUF433 family)